MEEGCDYELIFGSCIVIRLERFGEVLVNYLFMGGVLGRYLMSWLDWQLAGSAQAG